MATALQILKNRYAREGYTLDVTRDVHDEYVNEAVLGCFAKAYNDDLTAEFTVRERPNGNRIISTYINANGRTEREDWPSDEEDQITLWDVLLSVSDNVKMFSFYVA